MQKITENDLNEIAVFKYEVIHDLVVHRNSYKNDKEFFLVASKKIYTFKGKTISISSSTIARWYYSYRKKGFDGLKPKRRDDFGKMRKITTDVIDFTTEQVTTFPRMPATQILEELKKKGYVNLSLSTINRLVNKIKSSSVDEMKSQMLRYERPHINEVWCGDSTVMWADSISAKTQKIYIIALIDDASRKVVGARAYLNDNSINLVDVIKNAVLKSGIPAVFNFDNGKNYKNAQMEIIASKIGSRIHYCRPYTPTAKAKIERWFRTLKDHWTPTKLKSMEEIQKSLDNYVNKYNTDVHSSLNGLTPAERFNQELETIRWLADDKKETAFLYEIERKASIDGIVRVEKIDYEVGLKYQGNRVRIVYQPDMRKVFIKDGENLTEIFVLNKVANASANRIKIVDLCEENKYD